MAAVALEHQRADAWFAALMRMVVCSLLLPEKRVSIFDRPVTTTPPKKWVVPFPLLFLLVQGGGKVPHQKTEPRSSPTTQEYLGSFEVALDLWTVLNFHPIIESYMDGYCEEYIHSC